jgi:hypothetical protein
MLSRHACLALVALLCNGCVASRPPDAPPMSPDAANGQAIVTAIGTPFYALFRVTSCLVSAVVAVPSTAALALTDREDRREEQAAMYAGVGQNCYGSYAFEPI